MSSQTPYSVYVGHLHKDIGKTELFEVFQHCGDIVGTYVADNREKDPFYYGFVRFLEPSSALTAVRELDQWPLKGLKISVELSRETQDRLRHEGILPKLARVPTSKVLVPKEAEKTRMSMDYMMKESWFRDCCTEINVKRGPQGHKLNAENILADVSKLDFKKPPVLQGEMVGDDLGNISYIKKDMNRREQAGKIPLNSTKKFFNMLQEILHSVVDIAREEEEGDTEAQTAGSDPSLNSEKTSESQNGEPQFVASLATAVRKTYLEPKVTNKRKEIEGKGEGSVQSLQDDLDPGQIGRSRQHVQAHDKNNDIDERSLDKVDKKVFEVQTHEMKIEIDKRSQDKVDKKMVRVNSECQSTDGILVSDVCLENYEVRDHKTFENKSKVKEPFSEELHCSLSSEIDESDLMLIADFEREFSNVQRPLSPIGSTDSEDEDEQYQRFTEISSMNSHKHMPCEIPNIDLDESRNIKSLHTKRSFSGTPRSLDDPSSKSEQAYHSSTTNTSFNLSNKLSARSNVPPGPMRLQQRPNVSNDFIGSENDQSESVICKELSSYLKQILHIDGAENVPKSQEVSVKSPIDSTVTGQQSDPVLRPAGRGMSAALQRLRSMEVRPGIKTSSLHSSSHPQISSSRSQQSPPQKLLHHHPLNPENLPGYQMNSVRKKEEIPPKEASETRVHTRTRFRESPSSYSSLRHPRNPFDNSGFTCQSNSSLESSVCSNGFDNSNRPQEGDSTMETTNLEIGASRRHFHDRQKNLRVSEDHSHALETNYKPLSPDSDAAGADSGVESDGFRPIRTKRNISYGLEKVTSAGLQYLGQPAEDRVGKLLKTIMGRGRGYLNQQE